ncbi:hypothetical protein [Chryseobacterium cucumeris]|nr:hypothetical protein [Chryseobacterium cucumeris]
MKKVFQMFFSHQTIEVTDAPTGKKQTATYFMLFGLPLTIIYKSASK